MGGIRRLARTTRAKVVVAALAAAVVTAPASVLASHFFSDVPDTHPFHKEISAISDAGISGPFPDGTFRPSIDVTRQAAAAFHERSGGRVFTNRTLVFMDASESSNVVDVTVDSGASKQGNGFVHLSASGYAYTYESHLCPCLLTLNLLRDDSLLGTTSYVNIPGGSGLQLENFAVELTVPIEADVVEAYRLRVSVSDADAKFIGVDAALTGSYFPFSSTGTNSPVPVLTCPADDGYEQNDTPATARNYEIQVPVSVRAVSCPADPDFWRVHLPVGGSLNASIFFNHAEGDVDLCLRNSSNAIVQCSTSKDNDESIAVTGLAAGSYVLDVLLVSDTGAAPGNQYTLNAFGGAASSAAAAAPVVSDGGSGGPPRP